MQQEEKTIQKILNKKLRGLQKKHLHLEDLELFYERNRRGQYLTKLRAKLKGKTMLLSQTNYSLSDSLDSLFLKLENFLMKRKFRKSKRLRLNYGG